MLDYRLDCHHALQGIGLVSMPDISFIDVTVNRRTIRFALPGAVSDSRNKNKIVDLQSGLQPTVECLKEAICKAFGVLKHEHKLILRSLEEGTTWREGQSREASQLIDDLGLAGPVLQADLSGKSIQVLIRTMSSENITLSVEQQDTIKDIKRIIQDIKGIPDDQQRLIYDGKQLEDGYSLEHYAIGHKATLHLIVR